MSTSDGVNFVAKMSLKNLTFSKSLCFGLYGAIVISYVSGKITNCCVYAHLGSQTDFRIH